MGISFLLFLSGVDASAQNKKWTLNDCIDYALSRNVTIRKSKVTMNENEVNLAQSKLNRFPSVSGSASSSFSWQKEQMLEENNFGTRQRSNTASFGLNASATVYNGGKLNNEIKQADIDFRSSKYDTEAEQESVQLNILDAYLEILYAKEGIKNSQAQILSTNHELELAKERLDVGLISQSDYLEIKSELASEKSTLADNESTLATDRVSLMQLMELPLDSTFEIGSPDLSNLLTKTAVPSSSSVYTMALTFKPSIKSAVLNVKSAEVYEKIEHADLLPTLSLSGSLSTGWSDELSGYSKSSQLKNQYTPSIGLSLSVPIFSNHSGRNNVKLARLSTSDARLDLIDTQNDLRKNIEYACVDLTTAQKKYQAAVEEYQSANESYTVASEKYKEGVINLADFMDIKASLIESESDLIKQKFNLIFSHKRLDFYKGLPLSLSK